MLPYKHYIRKFNGTTYDYYNWVTGGILISGTKTELNVAPEGWEEYDTSFDRSSVDLGVITTFTTPMTFHEDGASILRYVNYTFGINEELEIYIEKFNYSDYTYSDYLIAEFDFNTFLDTDDGVRIMAREGGFFKKLTARENTVYTYDLAENTDVKWLKHDGILMQSRLKFNSNGNPDTDPFGETNIEYVLVNYIDTEGTNYYTNIFDVYPLGNRYFMQNTFTSAISYTIRIKGTCLIDFDIPGSAYFSMGIEIRDGSNSLVSKTTYFSDTISGTANVYNFDHTEIISLNQNHKVCIVYGCTTGAGFSFTLLPISSYSTQDFYAYVDVDFTNRYETTYIPCLHISKVVELVCNSINDGTIPSTTSDLFDNMEIWLSSGDGVRGLEKSQINFTFSEIRDFLRGVFGAVFQFDGTTAIFSNISEAFNKTLCYDVGEVKNVKVSNYLSELSVNIKVGHTFTNTDSDATNDNTITNGKDEFNTETHYITPLTQVKGDKNFISPYIASMYSIESIRVNNDGKEFADSENDNEICVFHVDPNIGSYYNTVTGVTIDYQELYRKPINLTAGASFWKIYNIYSPESAYNIELSPARCIRRLGSWFRSLYQYSDADFMSYTASGKNNTANQKMYTSEGATPIDIHEDWDIQIEDLCVNDQLLFKPFLMELELMESDSLVDAIKANKYGYITFTKDGYTYKGYNMTTKIKTTFKGTGKLTLLCTEDTVIDNLVR